MHTSTNVDVADMYAEKSLLKNDKLFYEYNSELLPVIEKLITVKYKKGKLIPKVFKLTLLITVQ
jgi:acyl-homoserine lactone acylase PvdQ